MYCTHCTRPIVAAPPYLRVAFTHSTGYQYCTIAGAVAGTKATPAAGKD